MTLVEFLPRRLIAARERVQQQHPATATHPAAPDDASIGELRRRILAAAHDPEAIDRLADVLSPREIRAVVGGLERWDDLRGECARIIRRRASARLVVILWGAWQRQPVLAELRTLLQELGSAFGWGHAVPQAYALVAPLWVDAPGLGVQRWLDEQGLSATDVPALSGRPIVPDSPLELLVRQFVLTHGSLAQLRTDVASIFEWQRQLAPEPAILFGRNYLIKLPPAEWTEDVVQVLKTRYGTPRKPIVARFWEPIPDAVKDAFQRRYIQARIKAELGHDHDRERFWNRWAHEIADLHKGRAGDVRFAELEFSTFTVFEFFETGHAAYFYLPRDGAPLRTRRANSPADLKERHFYPFARGRDNRLIHNPPAGWYDKGDRIVRTYLRGTAAQS